MEDTKETKIEQTPFDMIQKEEIQKEEISEIEKEIEQSIESENKKEDHEEEKSTQTRDLEKEQKKESEEKEDRSKENGEEEYDVKLKANVAKYFAEGLKNSGDLPEDFEITEDITRDEIDEAYRSYKEEPLRNQVRKEVMQDLEDEGFTEDLIKEVKYKHGKVEDEEIQKLNLYSIMSSYNFDEKDNDFDKDAEDFLSTYYSLKNVPKRRIETLVTSDLNDDALPSILEDYQKELNNEAVNLEKEFDRRYEDKVKDQKKKRQEKFEKEMDMIHSGSVKSLNLSEEDQTTLDKAFNEKDQIIKGPDGKLYRTTLYGKRLMESKQDPELELLQKIYLVLGSDLKDIKNKQTKKATNNIVKSLNNYVEVDVKKKDKDNSDNKSDNKIQRQSL